MGNVRYLLDTHTFLWSVRESNRLGENAKKVITDKHFQKFVSAVSAYEVIYKYRIGKLNEYDVIAENYLGLLSIFGATRLSIDTEHAHFAGRFDWSHRDPFDRILVAQAKIENMILVTNDPAISKLNLVETLW
jgi:PIN domain nuclease of toxin-antitoxin system